MRCSLKTRQANSLPCRAKIKLATIATTLQQATQQLTHAGIDSAALDARLLLQHVLDCTHSDLVANGSKPLSHDNKQAFTTLVQRRLQREPVSQLIGHKAFWKDTFIITRDVLTPRSDSETLIEAMLAEKPDTLQPYRILDMGTGSGCLLLSLLREYPHAYGTGLDRSPSALQVAAHNAKRLELSARCHFLCGDWIETLQTTYDMIITNPPYIAASECSSLDPELSYEPEMALFGGDDGLDAYRHIIATCQTVLKPGGVMVIECGVSQANDLAAMARSAGWNLRGTRRDLAGIERAIIVEKSKHKEATHAQKTKQQ